jgi:predicted enzyme related to lactoylglutathione lyase
MILTQKPLWLELKVMQSALFRITINSNQPDNLVQFYSLIGFQFKLKKVDKGSQVWSGELQGMQMEIFGISESFTQRSPSVQFSFQVSELQKTVDQIRPLGVQIMMEPLEMSTGIMCFMMDPDGRSVELVQPSPS